MAMLADSVEVVIGVDTHKHTHTAAVVAAATGQTMDDHDRGRHPGRLPAALGTRRPTRTVGGCGRSRAPAATALA